MSVEIEIISFSNFPDLTAIIVLAILESLFITVFSVLKVMDPTLVSIRSREEKMGLSMPSKRLRSRTYQRGRKKTH